MLIVVLSGHLFISGYLNLAGNINMARFFLDY